MDNHQSISHSLINWLDKTSRILILLALILCHQRWPVLANSSSSLLADEDLSKDIPDACESCKILVKSFKLGMKKTMRGKHEGGDTSWEEKNLKSYTDSEIRLVEIQEQLCDDVPKGKDQCYLIADEAETEIEDWWFKHRKNNIKLHDYLCINKLKRCCPEESYGSDCKRCPSHCSKHGACDGSGTRDGTGECNCFTGYTGSDCETCDKDFYRTNTQSNGDHNEQLEFTCLACHSACLGGCNGPGPANCTECKPGYRRDPDSNSCLDINECEVGLESKKLCPDGTYCSNTDGSYKCADCHRSCATCLGYGRDRCIACAMDYFMDDNRNCLTELEASTMSTSARGSIGDSKWRFFTSEAMPNCWLSAFFCFMGKVLLDIFNVWQPRTRTALMVVLLVLLQSNIFLDLYKSDSERKEEALNRFEEKLRAEL